MRSLSVLILIASLTACSLTPPVIQPRTSSYTVPTFPSLALEDHPVDLRGFCLSGDEAAKLALYINQLENLLKEK